jgi:molecular chaperone GrpE
MSDKADKNGKATDSDAPEKADDSKPSAELEKAKKDYLYLLAEFDNYRKNAIKERSDLIKYGSEKLVREFLNILDNFERALEAGGNGEGLREGVQMIMSELRQTLQRFGVEEVKSEGLVFDPANHEALSSEPRTDMEPGHVARVFKKAYKMHDKLLRPAQVVVSSAPEGEK